MSDTPLTASGFHDLELSAPLLKALDEVGYEMPSPIQAQAIPHLLKGLDLLGHAPTGTGKTAAFALPLLSRIDVNAKHVQVMTLTPTRELAIQVAEAFQRYASHIPGFHVLPVYGGQEYSGQIRALKRGVHVVVGTPGRVMDHMRKGTLKLDRLQALVLDEADEMLRMGFVDEVEWILEQTPERRQMALFSATMPREVERIARRHLHEPQEISIKARTATAETIRQRYWQVSGVHKLDALTRILEVEVFDAILVFVRTKTATTELAEKLEARGYAAAAMNGDMAQNMREKMVNRFKKGSLDILVATDVAARGLDVDRISHVINYDIPYDTEAYIHRIGRTGRAGRSGEAILFVSPRERRMLNAIERATRQKIEPLELPTSELVNNKRISDFKQKITDTLGSGELAFMQSIVDAYQQEHDVPAIEVAAALAKMSIGDRPFLMRPDKERVAGAFGEDRKSRNAKPKREQGGQRAKRRARGDADKDRYRLDVGYRHGVKPGNIVGAIANEAGIDSEYIGQIEIDTNFTLIDLPKGMLPEVLEELKNVKVCGTRLNIMLLEGEPPARKNTKRSFGKNKSDQKRSFTKKPRGKFSAKPDGDKKPKSKGKFDKQSDDKSARGKSFAKPDGEKNPKSKKKFGKPGDDKSASGKSFAKPDGEKKPKPKKKFGKQGDDKSARGEKKAPTKWAAKKQAGNRSKSVKKKPSGR